MQNSIFHKIHPIGKLTKRPLTFIFVLLVICSMVVFYTTINISKNALFDSSIADVYYGKPHDKYRSVQIFNKSWLTHEIEKQDNNEINDNVNESSAEQLTDFQNAEKSSNVAGKFFEEYSSPEFPVYEKHKNVNYCNGVILTDPAFLSFNNEVFQVYNLNDSFILYLYSAFFDNRFADHKVRVILMTNHQTATREEKWKCLLWYDGYKEPLLVDAFSTTLWPDHWKFGIRDGVYGPEIMTCDSPKSYHGITPRAVSVLKAEDCSEIEEEPSNVLRIEGTTKRTRNEKQTISVGVCCKGFRYGEKDMGVRMIEWIEMLRLFGADKAYLYTYGIAGKTESILEQYQKDGFIEFRQLRFPGDQANVDIFYQYYYNKVGSKIWPQEMMELNDCFYRGLAEHDYIAVFDLDELIVPVQDPTWPELLARIENNTANNSHPFHYIYNQHSFMLEELEEKKYVSEDDSVMEPIPDYLFFMKHTYRSGFKGKKNMKSFFNSQTVTVVHNHFPMKCWDGKQEFGGCVSYAADPNTTSRMFHFRHNRHTKKHIECSPGEPDYCIYHDTTLWKYYEDLKDAVENKIKQFYS